MCHLSSHYFSVFTHKCGVQSLFQGCITRPYIWLSFLVWVAHTAGLACGIATCIQLKNLKERNLPLLLLPKPMH